MISPPPLSEENEEEKEVVLSESEKALIKEFKEKILDQLPKYVGV